MYYVNIFIYYLLKLFIIYFNYLFKLLIVFI